MERLPLTVVVLTKNEEENIGPCLNSVYGWAGEIIVVDDESTDRTVAIAEDFADRVFHRKMDIEGVHRNWAYAQAAHDWVLSLDADELATEELKDEISATIPQTDYSAYSIPLKTYIGDYWVRYSGWYPASKIRLLRKSRCRYEDAEVHPRVFTDGPTGKLTHNIIHKGYPDFEHFLLSVNRQSTLEAKKWLRTGLNITTGYVVRRTVDRFLRIYIRKRGFKDGFIGFMIAFFASLYQILSYAKYWELKQRGENKAERGMGEDIKSDQVMKGCQV
jgi:glycosyltransferase involved in cell wall biosynthesis